MIDRTEYPYIERVLEMPQGYIANHLGNDLALDRLLWILDRCPGLLEAYEVKIQELKDLKDKQNVQCSV